MVFILNQIYFSIIDYLTEKSTTRELNRLRNIYLRHCGDVVQGRRSQVQALRHQNDQEENADRSRMR